LYIDIRRVKRLRSFTEFSVYVKSLETKMPLRAS
jgi:hypothetical protein